MQYVPLKPELVSALNLEQLGYTHPEAVLLALESAQHELCHDLELNPGDVFSLGNNILQVFSTAQANVNLTENDSQLICDSLLQYVNTGAHPARIAHFNFCSGDKMVGISTFTNMTLDINGFSVPCFAHATLYLENHSILSVVFAHIN